MNVREIADEKQISHTQNLIWVTFANLFARLVYFISSIVVARYLFPKDFGIISMALTFSSLIECSSQFGLDSFLIYRQNLKYIETNSILILNLVIAALFSSVMIIGSSAAATAYRTPEIKIILIISAINFFMNRLGGNYRVLLLKKMRQDIISKIDIITNLTNSVLIIVFAMLGFKYMSYVIPSLISQILLTSLYVYNGDWSFSRQLDFKIIKEVLKYSKSYMPQALLSYFLDKTDYILVGYLLGASILGYYYFGFEKAILIVVIVKSILLTLYNPIFASLQNNIKELNNTFNSLSMKLSYVIYPIIFGMIILAPEFLNILFGTRWNNSILTFQLILGYVFLKLISDLIIVIFNSTGHPEQSLRHYLIMTPLFVGAFYIATKYGGLKGISFASFVMQSLGSLLLLLRYCKFYKQKFETIIFYPTKIFSMLFLQALLLLPLKVFLYKIHANVYEVFAVVVISLVILYYFQTKILLKEIYNDFLIPNITKFLSIIKRTKVNLEPMEGQ